MTSYAREFALAAKRATPEKYFHSLEVATEMYSSFGPLMERYQLFVCPTTAIPAVAADHDQSRDKVVINGVEVDPILGWVMTLPFNMMSRCPVLSLPSGRASNGVPTGIQLVGPTYADEAVFQAGCAYEKAFGEWYLDSDKRPDITAAQS